MKKLFLIVAVALGHLGHAQLTPNSAEIYQGLKKLNVLGSVLYVAAHPDDENTRLLSFYSQEKLFRTGYLSITRGDGGQNLIGDEQGVDLGLIRTQELLSARAIDGAEQFFTRAFDFGYSKNPEETLEKWNREKILSDVVWIIRKFQPDVIITRFPVTGEGGHGHHTASSILANEAFEAAADPKKFPEQLKWFQPWKAKRIAWNSFNFNNNQAPENALKLDVGGFNPVLGKSYGEIASESRSQHKSQGFGVARIRGTAWEYFTITGGEKPNEDLFEDVVYSWKRIPGGARVEKLLDEAIHAFNFVEPAASLPRLANIYKEIQLLKDGYWRNKKLQEVKQLMEQVSGIWIDAFTSHSTVAAGDSMKVNFVVNNRTGARVKLNSINMMGYKTAPVKALAKNNNEIFQQTIFVPADFTPSQPYWLKKEMAAGSFNVDDQELIGKPDAEPAFKVQFNIEFEGLELVIEKHLKYKYTDPVRGELYQPFIVLPPVTLELPAQPVVLVQGMNWKQKFEYVTQKNMDAVSIYSNKKLVLSKDALLKGSRGKFEALFDIASPGGNLPEDHTWLYELQPGTPAYQVQKISYNHIPEISYLKPAVVRNVFVRLKTAGKKIGYIAGAGDKVPGALLQLGYEVTLLDDHELSKNQLKSFDAIISGVRAYNTNEWLNNHYEKLMTYVQEGGNLIVQYNTSNQIGPVRAKIGPYPFNISRTRVSVETAPVTLLDPAHPVFNFPNKITAGDFEGWVQERSIYHAAAVDPAFTSLIRMNDPGEKSDDGSLIVTKYGKGFFTYTGLVFFRQLPAGVPGAYKLMANLIALNAAK